MLLPHGCADGLSQGCVLAQPVGGGAVDAARRKGQMDEQRKKSGQKHRVNPFSSHKISFDVSVIQFCRLFPGNDLLDAPHIGCCVCKGAPVAADDLVAAGQAVEIQQGVMLTGHGIAVDGAGLIADNFPEAAAEQIFLALVRRWPGRSGSPGEPEAPVPSRR